MGVRTIYGEIAERGTRRSLDFDIGGFEEEEDRLEGVFIDGSDI